MIETTFNHTYNYIEIAPAACAGTFRVRIGADEVGPLIAKLNELRLYFPLLPTLPRPAMLEDDFAALQDEERYDDQSWGH